MPGTLKEFIVSQFPVLLKNVDGSTRLPHSIYAEAQALKPFFADYSGKFTIDKVDLKSQYEDVIKTFKDGMPDAKALSAFLTQMDVSIDKLFDGIISEQSMSIDPRQLNYLKSYIKQALVVTLTEQALSQDLTRNLQISFMRDLLLGLMRNLYKASEMDDNIENFYSTRCKDIYFDINNYMKIADVLSKISHEKFLNKQQFLKKMDPMIDINEFRAMPQKFREAQLEHSWNSYIKVQNNPYQLFLTSDQIAWCKNEDSYENAGNSRFKKEMQEHQTQVIGNILIGGGLARNFNPDTLLYKTLEAHLSNNLPRLMNGESIEQVLPQKLIKFLNNYDHFENQLRQLNILVKGFNENEKGSPKYLALKTLCDSLVQAKNNLQQNGNMTVFKQECGNAIKVAEDSILLQTSWWSEYVKPALLSIQAVFTSYLKWEKTEDVIRKEVTTQLSHELHTMQKISDLKEALQTLKGPDEDIQPGHESIPK